MSGTNEPQKARAKPPPKTDESQERPPGVRCPRCECPHAPVLYTRQRENCTTRVRQCRHCGRRFSTYERTN